MMKNQNFPEVNQEALCVLKLSTKTKKLFVDYEKIERPLNNEFDKIIKQCIEHKCNVKTILNLIKNHPHLKFILGKFSYCKILNSSYQGFYEEYDKIEAKYLSLFSNKKDVNEISNKENDLLINELIERLNAYHLELAYNKCEEQINKGIIIAYSHRKVGWSTPEYKINDNFSIEIKTNFGYGYVSYFYSRIKYKNLEIIPFSDWIKYKKAALHEIIRYTAKHSLKNESWLEALEFSKEAFNLSISNEIEFVNKYIIEECERMICGLESFLEGDRFRFINTERIYTDTKIAGHDLIEFRGEKISGALDFINNIIQFRSIINIDLYVNRIENCNKKVKPMLERESILIDKELKILKSNFEKIKPRIDTLEKRNSEYRELKKDLHQLIINEVDYVNSNYDINYLNKRFNENHKEYKIFNEKYQNEISEYNSLKSKINSLNATLENINKYLINISKYFTKKAAYELAKAGI